MKVQLGKLVNVKTGKLDANASSINGAYPFFTCSKEPLKISTYSYDCECVLVAGNGDLNVKYYNGKFDAYQRTYIIEDNGCKKIYIPYLYYFMDKYVEKLRTQSIGGVIKYIKLSNITEVEIVLPNVDIQKKIVDKLDKVNAVINKKNMQLEKLDLLVRSLFIEMFGDLKSNSKKWIKKTFTDIASIDTNMINVFDNYENYPHIGIESIEKETGEIIGYRTVKEDKVVSGKYLFTEQHIIYSKIRPNLNKVALPKCKGVCSADAYPILVKIDECHRVFLAYTMRSKIFLDYIIKLSNRTNLPKVNKKQVEGFICPVPPLDLQNRFADYVSSIDKSKYSSFSHLSA